MNVAALTAALVERDSRNPTLVPGAPGEGGVAQFLGEVLSSWGFSVELTDVADGRLNLVARVGRPGGTTLLLNGHLDVVSTQGMTHPPFAPTVCDGRLYGRGSTDMKGGVAAMCVAARNAAAQGLDGQVIVAAVIDEECNSLGTRALIASGLRADAAIVTEPTRLAICPAHRGLVWAEVDVRGRAAHGSRYEVGVDAITHAALMLAELDRLQHSIFPTRTHPLLGRGSLHASTIRGGTGLSIYPESCHVGIERRTIPGETPDTFLDELRAASKAVRRTYPEFDASIRFTVTNDPSDVAVDASIVQHLAAALDAEQLPVRIEGMSAWTDCALLNEAGIPAVCFGPGDITLAHAAEEYVELAELDTAEHVLRRVILDWCNAPTPNSTP